MKVSKKGHIKQMLERSDGALTSDLKGDILEELVKTLFAEIPGLSFWGKNVLDIYRAQEFDVVFTNDVRVSELYFMDPLIITECKNTKKPLGSCEVGWFVRKLQDRGMSCGILISLYGITGNADKEMNAHREVIDALTRDKITILILSRAELQNMNGPEDLCKLLKAKYDALKLLRKII